MAGSDWPALDSRCDCDAKVWTGHGRRLQNGGQFCAECWLGVYRRTRRWAAGAAQEGGPGRGEGTNGRERCRIRAGGAGNAGCGP